MAYIRSDEKQMLLVAVNASNEQKFVAIPSEWRDSTAVYGQVPQQGDLQLPALDCAVLKLENQ